MNMGGYPKFGSLPGRMFQHRQGKFTKDLRGLKYQRSGSPAEKDIANKFLDPIAEPARDARESSEGSE